MNNTLPSKGLSRPLKWFYILILIVMFFSGFGQMPIYGRYFISSIPGLAWSGDFFVVQIVHLSTSFLLLGLIAYYVVSRALAQTFWPPQNPQAWLRGALFLVLVISGGILAAKNLSWGVFISPTVIIAASLAHLGAAMVLLIAVVTYFRFGRTTN